MQFRLKKITSDASFREFYRLRKGKKTTIIVKAKKEKFKNLIAYSAINKFLRARDIHTPKLISQNFKEGIIEIEDFGDKNLLYYLKKNKTKLPIYRKCVDVILKIQKIKPVSKIRLNSNKYLKFNSYNIKSLHKESNLFFDWYLPGVIGKKKTLKYKNSIKRELSKLYRKIYFKNKFIVHRDFHVSNIIITKKKLGIIDTQDVILGNPVYDLASLIDDVRVKVSSQVKRKIFQYYCAKCSVKKKTGLIKK